MDFKYDIIVVGAGHAGCEAAAAAANLGSKTLLITMDMNTIGQMSCNPAVGGIAKGQIVREIDALGGQMAQVTDRSAIQFRMLNRSKGPAMWSPRSQSDRKQFIKEWINTLSTTNNLYIWQDVVTELLVKNQQIYGVKTQLGIEMQAKAVILTNGTFLNGLLHFGRAQIQGGRISEPASYGITEQLVQLGFTTDRMKTGTPARIDKRSIDFTALIEQPGDEDWHQFSYLNTVHRQLKQMSCWITYTNPNTHEELRKGLPESPLYNGQIKSIGPRYCPSIETKLFTFPDKEQHQSQERQIPALQDFVTHARQRIERAVEARSDETRHHAVAGNCINNLHCISGLSCSFKGTFIKYVGVLRHGWFTFAAAKINDYLQTKAKFS